MPGIVKSENSKEFQALFAGLSQAFTPQKGLKAILTAMTLTAGGYIDEDVPVRTGQLKGSRVQAVSDNLVATITMTAPHGPFIEFGTRFMRAQPYFFKNIEQAFNEGKDMFQSYVSYLQAHRWQADGFIPKSGRATGSLSNPAYKINESKTTTMRSGGAKAPKRGRYISRRRDPKNPKKWVYVYPETGKIGKARGARSRRFSTT